MTGWHSSTCSTSWAATPPSSGQARLAARLLGAADTVRTGAGANVMPFLAPVLAQATESAAAALGPAEVRGRVRGRQAPEPGRRDQAGARRSRPPAASAAGHGARPGPLGQREAEVARLVADGLSNKQIGARLFISERTVDSHVRSILNKLGFNSRAQIAAWMVTDPLAAVPRKRQRH